MDSRLEGWPERPTLAARQLFEKYGEPSELTSERLIWHDRGPYVRIEVTRTETPHDFPKPHMDFVEHTIRYAVPAGKNDALIAFDGSLTIDRTAGELSARCDGEGHNVLTLNLANDIATGKTATAAARTQFSKIVVEDAQGKMPLYVSALQFDAGDETTAAVDVPTIPGSPKRMDARSSIDGAPMDAEILAYVIAIHENEIAAAMEAEARQPRAEVLEFATMLHAQHGENLVATMKVGQDLKVTPAETPAVDAIRVKAAGHLAKLLPLEGELFEDAFIDAMVKGHADVLVMLDGYALTATDPALKAHLAATREHVAMHLERAKMIQTGGTASR